MSADVYCKHKTKEDRLEIGNLYHVKPLLVKQGRYVVGVLQYYTLS